MVPFPSPLSQSHLALPSATVRPPHPTHAVLRNSRAAVDCRRGDSLKSQRCGTEKEKKKNTNDGSAFVIIVRVAENGRPRRVYCRCIDVWGVRGSDLNFNFGGASPTEATSLYVLICRYIWCISGCILHALIDRTPYTHTHAYTAYHHAVSNRLAPCTRARQRAST